MDIGRYGQSEAVFHQIQDAKALLERSRRLLDRMHAEDQEEAIDLHEKIESTIASRDTARLGGACEELKELLFFVEGQ